MRSPSDKISSRRQRRPNIPTVGLVSAIFGNALSKPLSLMAVPTSVPSGTVSATCQHPSGRAYITDTFRQPPVRRSTQDAAGASSSNDSAVGSVVITCLGPLGERIYKACGNAIEHRPHHHFKSAIGKGVIHREKDLAGVGGQLLKPPGSRQGRKRTINQMDRDRFRILVFVARGKRLLDTRNTDGDGGLHAMFIAVLNMRAAAPRHEFRILVDVGHQHKHWFSAVWDQNGALDCMHRIP